MRKANTNRLLPWLLALLLAGPALAQPARRPVLQPRAPALPPQLRTDSTDNLRALAPPLPADAAPSPPLRRPADARLTDLRRQRDFQYVEGKPAQPSLWDRFWAWFWQWVASMLSKTGVSSRSWNVIFYVVMGGLLAFGILKLLQVDFTRLFGRSARAASLDYETGQENIHELNFPDALAEAEAAGHLRLAVRLGYLQLLKQLTDRALIDWQPDKTNQAYLHELGEQQPASRPAFTELTRQFEYVWYGEVPVPPALYRQVRASQQQFSRQVAGAGVTS